MCCQGKATPSLPKEIDIAKLNANENQLGLEPKVIMLTPSYMTYYSMPKRYGAQLAKAEDKNFATSPKITLSAINSKAKLVVSVNPNNPTGALMSNEDMDYYMTNVPKHVITVFDETYIE